MDSTPPRQTGDDDMVELRAAGFSDDDTWDIASITALFACSNRLAHAMALRPNEEFHVMGRVPRQDA